MDQQYSAFISHSSKDKAVAEKLVADLESKGLTCWIAPRNIPPGTDWTEQITRGIRASKCFVLLYSEASNLSDDVYREVRVAVGGNKPIYPVMLENVPFSDRLEYYISSSQWIDALEGVVSAQIERLRSAIGGGESILGASAAPRERVANSFVVPVSHDGPILPAPQPGETWEDILGKELVEKRGELDLGETGVEYTGMHQWVPWTLSWLSLSHIAGASPDLLAAGSKRVVTIHPEDPSYFPLYEVRSRWRRCICDVSGGVRYPWAAGNTSMQSLLSGPYTPLPGVGDGEEFYSAEWCRTHASRDGEFVIQTGLRLGFRSKYFLKRLFAKPDGKDYRYILRTKDRRGNLIGEWSTTDLISLHYPTRLSWSPTNRFVGISDDNGRLAATPVDIKDDALNFGDYGPSLGPDRLAYALSWHPSKDIYACAWRSETEHGFLVVSADTNEILIDQKLNRRAWTLCSSWSADGRYLAFGGQDHAIFIWDFMSGKATAKLGHSDNVVDVHFSPDGQRLLSSASDGTVRIWDPRDDGQAIATVDGIVAHNASNRVNGSPWSPDGRMFACFGGPAKIRVYRLT